MGLGRSGVVAARPNKNQQETTKVEKEQRARSRSQKGDVNSKQEASQRTTMATAEYIEPRQDVCAARCPDALIPALADVMEHLVQKHTKNQVQRKMHGYPPLSEGEGSVFWLNAPKISLIEYIKRLEKYFACSNEVYVLVLIYLDRVVSGEDLTINEHTVHQLFLTCLVVAAKYYDDRYYNNDFYARVGGVSTKELNKLEVELLKKLNWECYVNPGEYERYMEVIMDTKKPAVVVPAQPPSHKRVNEMYAARGYNSVASCSTAASPANGRGDDDSWP